MAPSFYQVVTLPREAILSPCAREAFFSLRASQPTFSYAGTTGLIFTLRFISVSSAHRRRYRRGLEKPSIRCKNLYAPLRPPPLNRSRTSTSWSPPTSEPCIGKIDRSWWRFVPSFSLSFSFSFAFLVFPLPAFGDPPLITVGRAHIGLTPKGVRTPAQTPRGFLVPHLHPRSDAALAAPGPLASPQSHSFSCSFLLLIDARLCDPSSVRNSPPWCGAPLFLPEDWVGVPKSFFLWLQDDYIFPKFPFSQDLSRTTFSLFQSFSRTYPDVLPPSLFDTGFYYLW